MKLGALFFLALLLTNNTQAASIVLLESPVRINAEKSAGAKANTTKLELTIQHGASEFTLSVSQRGNAADALTAQKSTSGWKDGYLFIRDDCVVDDPVSAVWRCVVDHVFTLVEDAKNKPAAKLIYVGDVFAGEECIEAARIGCALYKGTFTDVYDRLENNTLASRAESPALLIEMTVDGGVFQVDPEETWKANQERFLAGTRCLNAKSEMQSVRCIDGITPRRAYFFNTALATYTRQAEHLARTRSFARAALCERLGDAECSEVLHASALMLASIKPGEKARQRGNVLSSPARSVSTKH
jgi:hypothetical protein